jgi:hypothetical protein
MVRRWRIFASAVASLPAQVSRCGHQFSQRGSNSADSKKDQHEPDRAWPKRLA